MQHVFAQKTALEWDTFLRTQSEIVWERVRDYQQVLDDPQSVVNDYITTVEVPGLGDIKTVGNLVTLSETPGSVKGDPPVLGEANQEFLSRAGLTEEEIHDVEARATGQREAAFAALFGSDD